MGAVAAESAESADGVAFVNVHWAGRAVRIEHRWIARERTDLPLIVFLHEGLGSLSAWRGFPDALCAAVGARGLVYSRPGYGRSTPRAAEERWGVDFLQRQAGKVLPALLAALGVDALADRPWLFGHSDGGSIALLYAAQRPEAVAGVVAVAPHIFVEELSVRSIRRAREAYEAGDLRQRLARHHDDPDSAFWGWNHIWLDPAFRHWSIADDIAALRCPLLAVQGLDDEYGTLEQVRGIARRVPQTQLLELPACGHAVHRDQPQALITATAALVHGA